MKKDNLTESISYTICIFSFSVKTTNNPFLKPKICDSWTNFKTLQENKEAMTVNEMNFTFVSEKEFYPDSLKIP